MPAQVVADCILGFSAGNWRIPTHASIRETTMLAIKTPQQWIADRGLSIDDLVARSGIDQRVIDAILHGRYTPSPQQRQALAAALSVSTEQIAWGHVNPVESMYGHGPQFGRSP